MYHGKSMKVKKRVNGSITDEKQVNQSCNQAIKNKSVFYSFFFFLLKCIMYIQFLSLFTAWLPACPSFRFNLTNDEWKVVLLFLFFFAFFFLKTIPLKEHTVLDIICLKLKRWSFYIQLTQFNYILKGSLLH